MIQKMNADGSYRLKIETHDVTHQETGQLGWLSGTFTDEIVQLRRPSLMADLVNATVQAYAPPVEPTADEVAAREAQALLDATDKAMARVVEDLVELQGLKDQLPQEARERIQARRDARAVLAGSGT